MAKETLQRVVVPVEEFLSQDTNDANGNPRGMWSGYANLIGFLEPNYGSIFTPGCYVESIPSFLKNGFVPDSHSAANNYEYTLLGAYGYPTNAREDAKGLFFEGKFHSDGTSQTIRTRISERAADGLSVGMSIGFLTEKAFRIYPKDYERELPKYLAPQFLQQGLEDAKGWNSILIRQKVNLIENSLTLIPAMEPALVTEIQSATLGKFLPRVEEDMALSNVGTLINTLYWVCAYKAICDESLPVEDRRAFWEGSLEEFKQFNLQIFDTFASQEMNEDGMSKDEAGEVLHSMFTDPKIFSPLVGLLNKQHGEAALDAMKSYLNRQYSLAEANGKKKQTLSGKSVSKANHAALKAVSDEMATHCEGVMSCKNSLDEFLAKYDPNETESADISQDRLNAIKARVIRSRININ